MSTIDPHYLLADTVLFPQDDTKLLPSEADRNIISQKPEDFNFVSRCFFLAMRTLHVGFVPSFERYLGLLRRLGYMQAHMGQNPEIMVKKNKLKLI